MPQSLDPAVRALSPETRGLVAATWAFRTRAERESALRFRRLAQRLAELHALPVVVDLARKGAHQEHRHAQLCAAVCSRYGGEVPSQPAHDHPAVWPGLRGRDALLYEVVAFCCVAETINAQLLVTTLQHATAPRIVKVVRRLLRDEVSHGRMGWAHLAAERRQGIGDFLPGVLPHMLEASIAHGIFEDTPELVTPEAMEHGELPRLQRLDIFVAVLRDVLLPGFESLGVDIGPTRSWMQQKFPVRAP